MSGAPNLAEGFPTATHQQWRELVTGVLRKSGVDEERLADAPEAVLATRTYDEFDIAPLYTSDPATPDPGFPGLAPFTRGYRPEGVLTGGWDIRARHTDSDPKALRERLHADLMNGVSSLWISVGGQGLPAADLGGALTDVHLDLAPVVLSAGTDHVAAADALLRAHADADVPDGRIISHLGIDPLTTVARTGERSAIADAARFAVDRAEGRPGLGLFTADATVVHNAGGSDAQELGWAIAAGTAYLRALNEAGLDVAEAARRVEFRLAVNADQFAGIAKLRAVRAMWNQVLAAGGVPDGQRAMRVHATTSEAMLTRRDPHVNMLRTTVACFAAGVGGADAVTVEPFDAAIGLSDDLARRIARNTQSILVEESHLAQVLDPAGGSFFVESLTREVYRTGWEFFQQTERAGGAADALHSGLVREHVDAVWQQRRRDLARRSAPLTGVSEFPASDEILPARPVDPVRAVPQETGGPTTLPMRRYSQEYETLRERSDAHEAETGVRPVAFLATLGPVAVHTARASFATNLLAAGGVAVVDPGPLEDASGAAHAFADSGARVAVICSSDQVYDEHAESVARALKGAGARRVLLAGKPRDAHREAGVDAFAHVGCDAVAILTDLVDVLLTDPPPPAKEASDVETSTESTHGQGEGA